MLHHANVEVPPYTVNTAREHLNASNIEENALQEIFEHHGQNCIDGRKDSCAICTPGADAGNFLFKLASTELLGNCRLIEMQIEELFDDYLALHGQFNMHSDEHTLQHLSEYLEMSMDNVKRHLSHPDDPETMLEALMDPQYMGCGHLKMMLNESLIPGSQKYPGMRQELFCTFFRIFFRKLWSGDKRLSYVILEGDHQERAVFSIVSTDEEGNASPLDETSYVPMIQPHPKGRNLSAFVVYPDVERFTNMRWIAHINRKFDLHLDESSALVTMQTLRQIYLESTAEKLAHGLPMFVIPYNPVTGKLRADTLRQV